MVLKVKLRKLGNSVGLVLPKKALAHLKLKEGDSICLTEGPDRSLRLSLSSGEIARQLGKAQGVMKRYSHTLRELAK